jgi:Tfp pilus assembly protein PilV
MHRSRAGSQEGFALMEVVISAAVLLLVVLGVMAALDSVAGTAGANKARTVAAALAEKDQEELRSLKTADLNQIRALIPGPRTVNVDGVQYTIESDAVIVTDATGEDISCSLEDGSGSFVKITSKVTSPMTGAKVKPVVLSSIVAPEPGSGTLVAKVVNAENKPVKNMPVQAIGPETKTKATNDAGCAVFGAMTAGSYEVKVNQMGWVDPEGDQEVIKTATVSAGTLTTVDFVYDLAATVNVEIRTPIGSPAPLDNAYSIVAAHTGILTGYRVFPEAGPVQATNHTLPRLFPFENPYKLYSGRCTGVDPTLFDETYFATYPAAAPKLEPGEIRNITLYEPPVNINATFSQTWNNSRVIAYPRTADCGDPGRYDMGTVVSGTGRASSPGLPFGNYDICVQFRRSSNNVWYRTTTYANIDNANAAGTAVRTIAVNTTTTGQCP